jgi:4-amino-4-deoxy-L-arabinose transferase-like glycosyltransferase
LFRIQKEIFQLALIVIIGITIRLVAIQIANGSNYGPVDVFYADKYATRTILDFSSPYLQEYAVRTTEVVSFAYLPFVRIYYAPFYLLGDIRYGNILADAIIMVSVYFVAKHISPRRAILAPMVYAILPPSIALTSVVSTNIMVGTAFLTASLAFLLYGRHSGAAVFLGLAITSNQLIILTLPILILYFWKMEKSFYLLIAALISTAIILPFLVLSPSKFIYDVIEFQFVRPHQSNGIFSLDGVIYTAFGEALQTWIRVSIFGLLGVVTLAWFARRTDRLVISTGIFLLSGAFLLPVDGFWNYFLPAFAIGCIFVSRVLPRLKGFS